VGLERHKNEIKKVNGSKMDRNRYVLTTHCQCKTLKIYFVMNRLRGS
jgi:hypothetical protein